MLRAIDYFVFLALVALLQRIGDFVRFGYQHYLMGAVRLDKASDLVDKFDRLYYVKANTLAAYRLRKKGMAVGRLFFWRKDENHLHWLLLLSQGNQIINSNERWQDAKNQKITITINDLKYELVELSKPNHAKPVWTWRIANEDYNQYLNSSLAIITHQHNDLLISMIRKLSTDFLGFYGSRLQAKKAKDLLARAWQRHHDEKEPPIPFPEHFYYVRRVKDRGTTIRKLLAKSSS